MLANPHYVVTDPDEVKRLVRAHPWATIVSPAATGLVASHYPILLDEEAEGIAIVSHVGRPDDELHELGRHEVLVVVQGPHDYVSPSWYGNGEFIPTWNHVTAHLYGVPELLSEEENLATLARLTAHFEAGRPSAASLEQDHDLARRVARGTVGMRIRVTRFEARAKLSQNKAPEVRERVIAALEEANPALADEMRRAR